LKTGDFQALINTKDLWICCIYQINDSMTATDTSIIIDMQQHYDFLQLHQLDNHCRDYCRIIAKKKLHANSTLCMPAKFEQQTVATYMMRHDCNGAKTNDACKSLLTFYTKQKANTT